MLAVTKREQRLDFIWSMFSLLANSNNEENLLLLTIKLIFFKLSLNDTVSSAICEYSKKRKTYNLWIHCLFRLYLALNIYFHRFMLIFIFSPKSQQQWRLPTSAGMSSSLSLFNAALYSDLFHKFWFSLFFYIKKFFFLTILFSRLQICESQINELNWFYNGKWILLILN